jgi:long-chain acyl-CoA synthetase
LDWRAEPKIGPLDRVLDDAVAGCGDAPCLEFLGRLYSYNEVDDLVRRCAAGLQRLGVRRGDRVGLHLPNCPAYVIGFFGALKAGAVVVNLNPLYAERELALLLQDSECKVVISLDVPFLAQKLAGALAASPVRRVVACRLSDMLPAWKRLGDALIRLWRPHPAAASTPAVPWAELLDNGGTYDPTTVEPRQAIAVLQYTAGTAGPPKGVCLSHANLSANVWQIAHWFTAARPGGERFLAILPFTHAFGMTAVMNLGLALGAELILMPRFQAAEALRAIERLRPSFLCGVPQIFAALAGHPDAARRDLKSLRLCVSGGDYLPADVQRRFAALTGGLVVQGYGLTECAPVVCCAPFEGVHKPEACGLPLPGTVVEIVSLDDGVTVLPAMARGELCVRGPQVTAGYWRRPDETRNALRGGRLHTGDVGFLDDDGYVHVVDRLQDVVAVSGYKVYPAAVEQVLRRHPDVLDAAVVGRPDPRKGHVLKAHVVLRPGATTDQSSLDAFLASALSPAERPRAYVFVARLPKSALGKTRKSELA